MFGDTAQSSLRDLPLSVHQMPSPPRRELLGYFRASRSSSAPAPYPALFCWAGSFFRKVETPGPKCPEYYLSILASDSCSGP